MLTYDKVLTDEERHQLLTTLHNHRTERDSLLIRLMLYTGARSVEIVGSPGVPGVRLCDLSDGPMTVTIHAAKDSDDRDIPLPSEFYQELKAYIASLPHMTADTRIFPLTTRRFQQIWDAYRPASARTKGTHSLRHTAASLLYANTHDLLTVKTVLGHRQINNTQVYVTFDSARRRRSDMKGMWKQKLNGEKE